MGREGEDQRTLRAQSGSPRKTFNEGLSFVKSFGWYSRDTSRGIAFIGNHCEKLSNPEVLSLEGNLYIGKLTKWSPLLGIMRKK